MEQLFLFSLPDFFIVICNLPIFSRHYTVLQLNQTVLHEARQEVVETIRLKLQYHRDPERAEQIKQIKGW